DLMDWPFAGSISLLLLATALVVFYLYDRALGMSTLASGTARLERRGGRENPIARLGAWVGGWLTAILGWLCDRAAEMAERLAPPRPDRPGRRWGRGGLVGASGLVPALLPVS